MFSPEDIEAFQTAFSQADSVDAGVITVNDVEPVVHAVIADVSEKGINKVIKRIRKMVGKGQIPNENAIPFAAFMHAMIIVSFGKEAARNAGFMPQAIPVPAPVPPPNEPAEWPRNTLVPPQVEEGPPQVPPQQWPQNTIPATFSTPRGHVTRDGEASPPAEPAPGFFNRICPSTGPPAPATSNMVPYTPQGLPQMGAQGLRLQAQALIQANRLKQKEDVAVQVAMAMSASEMKSDAQMKEETALKMALARSVQEMPNDDDIKAKNEKLRQALAAMPAKSAPPSEPEENEGASDSTGSLEQENDRLRDLLEKERTKRKELKKEFKRAKADLQEAQSENQSLQEHLARSPRDPSPDPFALEAQRDLQQTIDNLENELERVNDAAHLGKINLEAQAAVALERAQNAEDELEELKREIQRAPRAASPASPQTPLVPEISVPSQQPAESGPAAPAEVVELQKTIRQMEKMLDNASRLQTRAEVGLEKSKTEAQEELQSREKAEAMLQQLMDRLNQLPEVSPATVAERTGISKVSRQSTSTRTSLAQRQLA